MHFSRHEKNVKTENTEPQRIVAIQCPYHTARGVSLHWVTQEPGLGTTTEHQEIAVACIASLSEA